MTAVEVAAAAAERAVLAHGGGLPETVMVTVPIGVLVVFVVLERRVRRREREDGGTDRDDA